MKCKNIKPSKNISFSLLLSKNLTLNAPYENNSPESKLLSNYKEIDKILNLKESHTLKYIYFNKDNIHKILYDSQKIININYYNLGNNLEELFYLDLLIMDNTNIINYEYNSEFISKIDNNPELYKIVIYKRIVIDLIQNYRGTDIYDKKKDDKVLISIENNCRKFIINNINFFKNLNLNYDEKRITKEKLDKIYIDIIIGLIKLNKFDDYEYTYNIIHELSLDTINITKTMFEQLYEILSLEKNYIKQYMILEIEDLFNMKKINFYYILLKYILKSSFYIYQFPFLLKTRKSIINIIKNNIEKLRKIKESYSIEKERIDYIVKVITDSEYYFNKYLFDNKLEQLKEINSYYKYFLFDSKKNDITIIDENIKNKKIENLDKYLVDYEKAKYINNRLPLIMYLYDLKLNIKNKLISENELNKNVDNYKLIEKMILDKKYKKLRREIKIKLVNYFNDRTNEKILKKIFKNNEYILFIKENIRFLTQNIEQNEINEKEINNKDDINTNTNMIKSTKEQSMLRIKQTDSVNKNNINEVKNDTNYIMQSCYIQSSSSISKDINFSKINEQNDISNILNIDSFSNEFEFFKKSDIYEIITYNKIIGQHKISEFVKKLSKGFYMSGGTNNKLILYNEYFKNVLKIV